jgi:hypothetical protein
MRAEDLSGKSGPVGWHNTGILSLPCPRPDTRDPLDGDVGDIAGHGSLGWGELNLRPKVSVSEPLEKSRSAPFGDTSYPVEDEILDKAALIVAARLERQGNPRVVADVADLAALCQVSGDNLVTIEADPHNRTKTVIETEEPGGPGSLILNS